MPVRLPTHRWWAGVAAALLVVACAQASAETPAAEVAGARLDRADQAFPVAGAPGEAPLSPDELELRAAGVRAAAAPTTTVAPLVPSTTVMAPPPTAPPPTAPVTTAPALRPAGERVVTATVGGVERSWTLIVPPGTAEAQHLPLLIVLHGVGGKGVAMRRLGFEKYAGPAGFMVAYPDAVGGSWNDGRPGMEALAGTPVDDVAFLRELIARAAADAGADPARVAIAGFSNGALMASRAACDMTDQLASVVLVSGSGPRDMTQRCRPSRPLPVMVVFGTADTVVPYDGGQVATYGGKARGQVAPVREVLDIWRGVNGCATSESAPLAGTSPAITTVRGAGCRADVVHYKVNGGGHDWVTNPTFDTTTEAWRFVSAHLLSGAQR